MTLLFLSDMHLQDTSIQNNVIDCIEKHRPHLKQLYLLGDIFNTWIGDEQRLDKNLQKFMLYIKNLKSFNIDVFMMHGNRDFLMGNDLCAYLNCVLLADPYILNHHNKKILLTHGDFLCTHDIAYQRLRCIVRNKYIQKLFLSLPYAWRKNIAEYIRNSSKKHTQTSLKHTLNIKYDVNLDEIENWHTKYQFDIILHGHTHQSYHYYNQHYQRVVLSDWHKHGGTYAVIYSNENTLKLETFYI
jgi:UDP-2,3-diacylglucosamine hydrolase